VIHAFRGILPSIDRSAFVVESAEIIGDVTIGKDSSVWFNAVIRGDVNAVRIGERTNIQDGCIVHVRHGAYPCVIGSNITVGHGAILHACTVGDNCLIGMGAIVLDAALIQPYTLVAAGAMVRERGTFPEGSLVGGIPAKVLRRLTDEERRMIEESASGYIEYARQYRDGSMKEEL
jgi:carbonic anhydrase/acetyltransferase-like protein (isoleucine patch superfamily)